MTIKEINLNRVLIINPFGIGDVLFTTPLIRNIRERFPDIYIGYVCNIRTAEILKANPYIDTVFVYERDYYRNLVKKSKIKCLKEFIMFLKSIKKDKFELAIDLSLGREYSFFCWLIGIKRRIGFNFKDRGIFLTNKINIDGYNDRHIVEYYLDLLRYIRIDYKNSNLDLFIPDKINNWSNEFLIEQGVSNDDILISIVPGGGASWGKDASMKHWPLRNFAKLANRLSEDYNVKILIMGDSKDKDLCLEVANRMRAKAIQCCGKTNIMEFAGLLRRCKLVITNDGGPLHIAVALGAKTVSIFGPVDDRVYGPYPRTPHHKVIKTNLFCQPCYHRFRLPICNKDKECLRSITVKQVFEAVKDLLS
jgi:heptosyltransferase-2/heptosyltransferase-3